MPTCIEQVHYRVGLAALHSALLRDPPSGYSPLTGGPDSLLGLLADAEGRAIPGMGDLVPINDMNSVAAAAIEMSLQGIPEEAVRQVRRALTELTRETGAAGVGNTYLLELPPVLAELVASGNPIRTRAEYNDALAVCTATGPTAVSVETVTAAAAAAANSARKLQQIADGKRAAAGAAGASNQTKAEYLRAQQEAQAAQERAAAAQAAAIEAQVDAGISPGGSAPSTSAGTSTMTMVALGVGALLVGALLFGGPKARTVNPQEA